MCFWGDDHLSTKQIRNDYIEENIKDNMKNDPNSCFEAGIPDIDYSFSPYNCFSIRFQPTLPCNDKAYCIQRRLGITNNQK